MTFEKESEEFSLTWNSRLRSGAGAVENEDMNVVRSKAFTTGKYNILFLTTVPRPPWRPREGRRRT